MSEQKSGKSGFSATPIGSLLARVMHTFQPPKKQEPGDAIDALVESLGESLIEPELLKPEVKPAPTSLFARLTSRFALRRSAANNAAPIEPLVAVTREQVREAEPQASEPEPTNTPSAKTRFTFAKFVPKFSAPKIALPKLTLPNLKNKPVVQEQSAAIDQAPSSVKQRSSRMRLLIFAGGGVAASALIGYFSFHVFAAHGHGKSHASVPVVAKHEGAEEAKPLADGKPAVETSAGKAQAGEEKPAASETHGAAPEEKAVASEAKPAASGEKSAEGGETKAAESGEAKSGEPGEAKSGESAEKEDSAPADAAAVDVGPSKEDQQVIAQIRPQVHHLCGLHVTKILGWNYRDGYLFCHIENRLHRDVSNLLQRSENDGRFTYIGGSEGLLRPEAMSELFLVDPSTAKGLLTHLISDQHFLRVAVKAS